MTGWQDYVVADDGASARCRRYPPGSRRRRPSGCFGITGMTAYFGLLDVGRMKEGDVVVVSGAAGATGSTVGQIASIKGAGEVVGIAGGEEKCAWIVDELGFDAAVDYKSENVAARLHEEPAPRASTSTSTTSAGRSSTPASPSSRCGAGSSLCGAISAYNDRAAVTGPANYINLIRSGAGWRAS